MIALQILFLCVPTLWELWNDRKGDFNKQADVYIRVGLMAGGAFPIHGFSWFEFASGFFLSAAIFFMFFDYLINIILYRNNVINYANWFSYTGKSGVVDNIPFWKKLNPWLKFSIRLVTLITAIIIYL
jgi:hypothetical protein